MVAGSRIHIDPYFITVHKTHLKWIKYPIIRTDTLDLIEEKVENILELIGPDKGL